MDEMPRQVVTISHNADPESAKNMKYTYLLGFTHGYTEAIIQLGEMIESYETKRNALKETWYSRLRNRKAIEGYEQDIDSLNFAIRVLRVFREINLTYVNNRIIIENIHPVIPLNTKDDE